MEYSPLSSEQTKVLLNATQVFEALEEERRQDSRFAGSMHWKHIAERDYLYRGYSGGRSQSLGVRSAETELTKQRFDVGKKDHKRRSKALAEEVKVHGRYIRASRLGRFPRSAARVVRAFQKAEIPHRVIGTNALYVYEVSAGVVFLPEHVATDDADFLLDDRQSLQISAKLGRRTLLSLIKKTDETFRPLTTSPVEFAAVNEAGYRVELITQGAKRPMQPSEWSRVVARDDLRPTEISSLKWFLASPHYSEVVFDEAGMPLRVDTVDPRAFVLFKHYVSQRDDRRPAKRRRDAEHARVVAELLQRELRHLPPSPAIDRIFPRKVAARARDASDEFSL